MKGGGERTVGQRAWSQSAACAAAAERGREQAAAQREAAPKCGAKRKADGRPCEGLALENGRCRVHGGLTPKGDQWHRVQYPNADAPPEKLEKKLLELDRRRRQRAKRVAAMTPEARAAYEARSHALRPRSPTVREQERRSREAAKLLASPKPAAESEEQVALRARYEELKAQLVRIDAALAADDATEHQEANNERSI